jgi:hypothetical protein
VPISQSAGRNVRLVYIIPARSGEIPPIPNPVLLDRHLPPALQDRVAGELAHVRRCEFVNLRSARVLFEEMGLGEVELKRVICIISKV